MATTILVQGLAELQRDLRAVARQAAKEVTDDLRDAAEPARAGSESEAVAEIRNIGGRWSRMRLGVTTRAVYVAPTTRRSGGSPRANLGSLLLQAMTVAVERELPAIEQRLEGALDGFISRHGL